MPEKTYTVMVDCDNCGASNTLTIPKGTPVKEFTGPPWTQKNSYGSSQQRPNAQICSNCGMFTLSADSPRAIQVSGW